MTTGGGLLRWVLGGRGFVTGLRVFCCGGTTILGGGTIASARTQKEPSLEISNCGRHRQMDAVPPKSDAATPWGPSLCLHMSSVTLVSSGLKTGNSTGGGAGAGAGGGAVAGAGGGAVAGAGAIGTVWDGWMGSPWVGSMGGAGAIGNIRDGSTGGDGSISSCRTGSPGLP